MTPSCPSATARSKNSCASSAESVTSRRTRSSSGTTSSSRASRSLVEDSIRESPSCSSRSKKNGRIPVAPLCVAVVDAVSWNGRGRPASSRVSASPSRIRSVAGSDRVASTTSGSRTTDLVEAAREDRHLVAVLVHLDPDAVELGVDGERCLDLLDTGSDVGSRAGEHRPDRSADEQAEVLERLGPTGQRGARDRSGRRAEHGRAAYGLQVEVGGGRDGVEHHRVEGALADVAGDQVAQEHLLGLGQATEQRRHRVAARTHRAGPGQRADLLQRRVDLDQPDGRLLGRLRQLGERAPAQAGAALAQRAGEVRRCDVDLLAPGVGHLAQQVGDQLALGQPRAGGGDLGGDVDEMCEQHGAHCVRRHRHVERRRHAYPAEMPAPAAPLVRVWRPDWPCPVGAILSTHRRGAGDPTFRRTSDGAIWRGIRTPEGTTTLRLLPDPPDGTGHG